MARIGSVAITTVESLVFDADVTGPGVVAFVVRNPSTNTATVSIRSDSCGHEAGKYWTLAPGEERELVARRAGIRKVSAKASANCNVEVLARIM